MILVETFSVPPSEKSRDFIKKSLENKVIQNIGFVMYVSRIDILKEEICNITANVICTAKIEAECFLPEVGMEIEAIVETSRDRVFIGVIKGKMRALFHSENDIPTGAKVNLRIQRISFQNRTYRAVAEISS